MPRAGAGRLARMLVTLGLLVLLPGPEPSVAAEWGDQGAVLTVIEENDLFINTDRHYTQGAKISFLHRDCEVGKVDDDCVLPARLRSLLDRLPASGFTPSVIKIGYELGQSIFTPTDLRARAVQVDDRPYAGWLYTGFILQRRGQVDGRWPVMENVQLDLGVIGPLSLAEEAQTEVHRYRGFDLPKGWSHQLHDEPGLALKYERSWLFSPSTSGPRYVDAIVRAGASLGNVETSLRTGVLLRVGINLPNDFGVETISSLTTTAGGRSRGGPRWGVYLFAGAEGWTVLYTAFLDGNLFRPSHSVEKHPWVGEGRFGAALQIDCVELAMTYAVRTPQFIGQRADDGYGSVSLKIRF